MTRGALAAILLVAACDKAPDPAAIASAREIDAAAAKAVRDTDGALAEAAAARTVAPEQTPR